MPLDAENCQPENESNVFAERRIYVCECGNVRVETRNYRRTFSPEEFINFARELCRKEKSRRNIGETKNEADYF